LITLLSLEVVVAVVVLAVEVVVLVDLERQRV